MLVALVGVAVVVVFERTAQSQTASPALAAQPSRPIGTASSRIAFITAVPKNRLPKGVQWQAEVYVMNADGSGKRRLTGTAWNFKPPVWSPDGLKLAFKRRLDPTKYKGQCGGCDADVFVMNADGSGQQNLTHNVASDGDPACSPDGQRIAFASNRDGKPEGLFAPPTDVHVMNADGSGQPVWSPDRQQIAFGRVVGGVGNNRDFGVYVMDADGSGQRNLTQNPAVDIAPAWSPDGRKLTFASNRDGSDDIYVMNADGSGQRRLTRNLAQDSWPVWSPDGQRIAFTRVRNTRSGATATPMST